MVVPTDSARRPKGRPVGSTGNSFLIEDAALHPELTTHPEWIREEGIHGFAGHPLTFRGEILGVLGAFGRTPFLDEHFRWLRLFADQAAVSIANARAFEELNALQQQLKQENDYLRAEANENFGGLLGQSPALKGILSQIELVASTDASVLILGESGTGKELIARALHDRSGRARRALVKVNCASIPRDLFESEFFGHTKGSFTGAVRDRVGRFQLADGGTLFLDEVAEIPLELQSKLSASCRKENLNGSETIVRGRLASGDRRNQPRPGARSGSGSVSPRPLFSSGRLPA